MNEELLKSKVGGIVCQCGNPINIDRINNFWLEEFNGYKKGLIEKLEQKYNSSKSEKITKGNRCIFAKQNETLGESQARHSGFLSGLLVAQGLIK